VVTGAGAAQRSRAVALDVGVDGVVITKEKEHANVAIIPAQGRCLEVLDLIGQKDPVRGWFALYAIEPSHDIVYRSSGKLPRHFETVVQPLPIGEAEPLTVKELEVTSVDGKTCAALACGNDLLLVCYDGPTEMACCDVRFQGTALLLTRDANAHPITGYLVDGKLLTVAGRLVFSTKVPKPAETVYVDFPKQKWTWKPLFDGKTLNGWHAVGDGTWSVENGAIVGRANNEKLYGLLFSNEEFDDFTVRFKFKVLTGDSGFYIRTVFKEPDQAHGNQVQVGLSGGGGGIYESYGRGWLDKPSDALQKNILKDGDWSEMVISAHGGDIVAYVNGNKTADLKDDPGRRKGHFAMQMHSRNVMHLMFKNIEIRSDR
jgi:hypothetical protein